MKVIRNRRINGIYYVADCETINDINYSMNRLMAFGCEIGDHFWDGKDCGNAYINFSFDEKDFVKIYKEFHVSASFTSDINKYIAPLALEGYTPMSKADLREITKKLSVDYSKGFQDRLPFRLLFEVKECNKMSVKEIIDKCLSFLKNGNTKVIGYATYLSDGDTYCEVLIESSYLNLTEEIMRFGIGDNCLAHRGWLNKYTYGEIQCTHEIANENNFKYDTINKIEKLLNEK